MAGERREERGDDKGVVAERGEERDDGRGVVSETREEGGERRGRKRAEKGRQWQQS